MNEKLLLTGGALRENGFELGEGKYYGCAKLLELDPGSGQVTERLAIREGNGNFPDEHPNLEFTVGAVDGDGLWLTTDTEVRRYAYPSLTLLATISHPCFHNLHSVAVRGNALYVTSTGLDMVVVLDKETGEIMEQVNTEGKPIWHRFSAELDYRRQHSTRPHDCHPNYIFWIDDEPWVTRCTQEDAVKLHDVEQRVNISRGRAPISIHDGLVRDGAAYFTTVDGAVVVMDCRSRQVIEDIDLTALRGYGGLRGWCRGLHISGDTLYVAFSRFRKTRRMEKLSWVRRALNLGEVIDDASVLAVDLNRREILADYRLGGGIIDAVYSILPEPGGAAAVA
jgi:hypothetical protein